jgi:hypothetical protein
VATDSRRAAPAARAVFRPSRATQICRLEMAADQQVSGIASVNSGNGWWPMAEGACLPLLRKKL